MQPYQPDEIILETSIADSPVAHNVLNRLPSTPVRWVKSAERMLQEAKQLQPSISRAKKSLILSRHRGRFFKPCPAGQTRGNVRNACCNYFVVNFASNCHMECSYCYLQTYLTFPHMVIYANIEDLFTELKEAISARPMELLRIGTGELADSLALDPLTGYGALLVDFFSEFDRAILEFKTKSDCVDGILGLNHRGRTVVSWSISPPYVQRTNEHKTASIEARLTAAEKCVQAGYPVAFHLDPLIHYEGWRRDYSRLVDEIYARIPAASIAWISLGSLRMTVSQQEHMRRRFPGSFLPRGELVACEDAKLRYFHPIRVSMFRFVIERIRRIDPHASIYTCMESSQTWRKVFGEPPPTEKELGNSLVQMIL